MATYSAALAYICLGFNVLWALKVTSHDNAYIFSYLFYLLSLSIVGVIRFGHPNTTKTVNRLYFFLNQSSLLLVLPMVQLEVMKEDLKDSQLAVAAVVVFVSFLVFWLQKSRLALAFMALNFILALTVSFTKSNTWLAFLSPMVLSHFLFFDAIVTNYDVPRSVLDGVGTVFLCLFVVNCA